MIKIAMNKHFTLYLSLSILLLFPLSMYAQPLSVSNAGNNGNASYLVQNVLIGGCLTVSNITYTGSSSAIGYFSNAGTMGISEGIVLSTGAVSSTPGPNGSGSQTTSFFTAGDATLNALPGGVTQDAAVLQFSFLPLSNSVSFNFIFASEEYPEFVGTTFNDVFGFFISGPGIVGQQNIALVPGTTTPITINTINATTNSSYYTANTGTVTQFDGYTKVLTATATGLTPCQTYTIKLAVGDVGDTAYDSAVFLEANSFNAGQSVAVQGVVPTSTNAAAYEGCQDGYFIFTRPSDADLSVPLDIPISITGSATPNIDYDALPSVATIAIGDTSVILNINAYTDALAEGSEDIIVSIQQLLCNCTSPPPDTISIYDSPEPFEAFVSNDPTICAGDDVLIGVIAAGSQFTPYVYQWSNGGSGPGIIVAPATTTTYSTTITDGCGRILNQAITVNVSNAAPNATITPVPPICSADGTITLQAVTDGGTWSGSGVDPISGIFDPTVALASGISPFTISYNINNSCGSDSDNIPIIVNTPGNPIITPVPLQCANGNPITLTANSAGGTWSGQGMVGGTNTTGQFNPALVSGNNTTITYTTTGSCGGVGTTTINLSPTPTATISGGGTVCGASGSPAPISITSTGGLPLTVVYAIDGVAQPPLTVATNPLLFPVTQAGDYTLISVTNANTCVGTTSGVATVIGSNLSANINATNPQCFNGTGSIAVVAANGALPYSYAWSANGIGNTPNPANLAAGTYTVTITDDNACTASAQTTITQPTQLVANVTQTTNTCIGQTDGSITLEVAGGTPNYSFAWNNGAGTNQNPNNLAANTYVVTVTDANACTASAQTTITNLALPTPAITGETLICNGQTTDLCVTTNFNQYNWSDANQTTQCLTVSTTGTYTVTVTNTDACTASANFTVNANSISANAFATNVSCGGYSDGAVSLSILGGTTPFTYTWNVSSIGNQQNPINLFPGDYQVTITDANGCSTNTQATITEPTAMQVNAFANNPSCGQTTGSIDVSILGGITPYSFDWSGSLPNVQNPTNVPNGSYTITVTDANGCTTTAQADITASGSMILNINTTDATCNGLANGSINLTVVGGNAPYSYNWSGTLPDNTPNHNNTVAAGNYSVTVTDAAACTATATAAITEPAAITVAATATNVLCATNNNGSINLNIVGGSTPYSFAWNNSLPPTQNQINNLAANTYTVTVSDLFNCSTATTVTITQPNAIQLSVTKTNVSCNGLANGAIATTVLGGTPPYSYNWSGTLPNTPTVNGLSAGMYSLTVTDANGCIRTDSYLITEPTAINLSVSTSNASCGTANGTANISANGGAGAYTYAWTPNTITGSTANTLTAGTYNVVVTDAANCSANTTFAITNANGPAITLVNISPQTCENTNGSIEISVSGGSGTPTILWSNNQTTSTINNLSAGNYSVTITDAAACLAVAAYDVLALNSPSITVSNINNATCGNANGSFTLTATGGTSPFSWSTGDNGVTVLVDALLPNTYTLTLTDATGCTASISQNISNANAPTIDNATVTNATCGLCNGNIALTTSGGVGTLTYTWDNGNTGANIGNLCQGTYTVIVSDQNGCTTTQAITLNNIPSPTTQIAIVQNATCNLCNGSLTTTTIDGTAPLTFAWSNTQTTADIGNLCAGTYTLTVTDANNCIAIDAITLNDLGLPTTQNITVTDETCSNANGAISFDATGGTGQLTYNWQGSPSTTNTATNLSANTYTVTITDQNGCTLSQTFTVNMPPLPIISNASTANANCGQANGSAAITAVAQNPTYQWTGSPSITNTANNLSAGSYTVVVTDQNGCTTDSLLTVALNNGPAITLDSITLEHCGLQDGSITLNINGGQQPYTYVWQEIAGLNQPIANNLSAGSYTLVATDAAGCQISQTFVVQSTAPPQISLNASPINCTDNVTMLCSINTSDAPIDTYLWSNTQTADSITLAPPTALTCYTVTVTDIYGCSTSAELCLTPPITPTITPDAITAAACGQATGSASVTANGGTGLYNFTWTNNVSTTEIATNIAAGIYTVTVTDGNDCTATTQLSVPQSNGPNITQTNTTPASCGQAIGSVEVIVQGGQAPLTYAWTPNISTTNSANNLNGGTYTVTVTDATACSQTASITVLTSTLPTLSISTTPTNCGLNEGSAIATAENGSGNYNYVWNDAANQTTATATNLATGTYTLTVTDTNGCTATNTGVVLGQISNPIVNCGTPSQTSITFVWDEVQGAIGYLVLIGTETDTLPPTQLSLTLTDLNPDTTITISVTALGDVLCGNSQATTQTCTSTACLPTPITITVPDSTLCATDAAIVLTANPANGTFSGNGIVGNNFNPATANTGINTITYNYVGANGCPYSQTQNIEVANVPIATFSILPDACVGETISLSTTPQPNITYVWQISDLGTQTQNSLDAVWTSAGVKTIQLTATNSFGCTTDTTQTIAISSMQATASADTTIRQGSTAQLNVTAISGLNGELSYEWQPTSTEISCTNCANPTAYPQNTTIYTVTVTDQYGCVATDMVTINVFYENSVLIPNSFSPNGDNVNDVFKISGSSIQSFDLHIFDRWGQVVFEIQDTDTSKGWDGTRDGIPVELGVYVYYLNVVFNDGKTKLVKGNLTLLR
jgi:gliding motility-associated-like protein